MRTALIVFAMAMAAAGAAATQPVSPAVREVPSVRPLPPATGPGGPSGTSFYKAPPVTTAVTDAMLNNPPAGDWLSWRRTTNSWGHSPLAQVNVRNVGKLALVWAKNLQAGVQEGTPLVHDGVIYMPLPFDTIQAIDARTGQTLWEHRRAMPDDLGKYFPNPDINRNIAIFENLIIDTSADDYVFALDAKTGEQVWETKVHDYRTHAAQQTSGPIIANGKVISGRGCEPEGGPDACVLTAHDARTGKELWRTRTIPRPGEPNGETWGDLPDAARWHVGAWMVPSFDPELNLLYFGTSVTSPSPKFALSGNDKTYLYHNSTLALDVETGKIVWHYQHVVDHWDLDHTFERILVDTAVTPDKASVKWINPRLKPGERRKVVTGIPGKTGIVYTLDARTGEFLWATPTVEQNVVQSIDGATGAVHVDPASVFNKIGDKRRICPGSNGGKNWPAGAYGPETGLMFMPLEHTCSNMTAILDKPSLDSLYGYRSRTIAVEETAKVGSLWAISASTGKTAWRYEQRAGMLAAMTTAGGLVFAGDASGMFRAFDQRTGKILWEVALGAPVTGYPVAFAAGGREYIAAGVGVSPSIGFINAMTPEMRSGTANGLFIFALPQ